jgi:hypothetical protein
MEKTFWIVLLVMSMIVLSGCEDTQTGLFINNIQDVCPNYEGVFCQYIITENNSETNITYAIENNTEMNVSVIR